MELSRNQKRRTLICSTLILQKILLDCKTLLSKKLKLTIKRFIFTDNLRGNSTNVLVAELKLTKFMITVNRLSKIYRSTTNTLLFTCKNDVIVVSAANVSMNQIPFCRDTTGELTDYLHTSLTS